MAGLGVRVASDMERSLQGVLKKRNRRNVRQRRHRRAARSPVEDMAFCAPHPVLAIFMVSLQERLGLTTKDADFSAVWLTRDQFSLTFLGQLGLMDMSDLLELSKRIGATILRVCG